MSASGRGSHHLGFTQGISRKPLSNIAMAMLLTRMGIANTVHGFRSIFRDCAAETTNVPNKVCEMAHAHAIPGKSVAAYMRGDLFLKRRRLIEQWGRFCTGTRNEAVAAGLNVLPSGFILPRPSALTCSQRTSAHCALCG